MTSDRSPRARSASCVSSRDAYPRAQPSSQGDVAFRTAIGDVVIAPEERLEFPSRRALREASTRSLRDIEHTLSADISPHGLPRPASIPSLIIHTLSRLTFNPLLLSPSSGIPLTPSHSSSLPRPCHTTMVRNPPVTVSEYVESYRHRFDALRFDAILETRDTAGGNEEDRATAWASRWRHVPCVEEVQENIPSDLQWLCLAGEREFVANLASIWSHLTSEDLALEPSSVRRHLCPWPHRHYRMYWLNRQRWGEDAQRDARLRNHVGAAHGGVRLMPGWNNTEFHSMPFRTRVNLYPVKPSWWHSHEPDQHLCVPTPTTLAYLGSETLTNGHGRAAVVWAIAFTEQVVNTFWSWLEASPWGLHNFAHRSTEPGFIAHKDDTEFRGRMFRITPPLVDKFHELGLDWLPYGSEITTEDGHQALRRMEWYFYHNQTKYWAVYDWDQDRFLEERIPTPVAIDPYDHDGDRVPGRDHRRERVRTPPVTVDNQRYGRSAKRRHTNDGWVAAIESANQGATVSPAPLAVVPTRAAREATAIAPPHMETVPAGGLSPAITTPSLQSNPPPVLVSAPLPPVASVPRKEFEEFQEVCREQRITVPKTVSDALKTACEALRKAALYEWLIKSMASFRESLETQMGLMCAQTTSVLNQQLAAAQRAEPQEGNQLGSGTPPVVTEAQLNGAGSVLRSRWRCHLAPVVNYPTGDPIGEVIAARLTTPVGSAANRRLDIKVIGLASPPDTE